MERAAGYTWRVKASRGRHRSSLTVLPVTRRTTTLHEQDSTKGILEHGGEAEAPSSTTETKTYCIRRIREAVTHDCIASLSGQHSTLLRSLPSAFDSSNGKRAQGFQPSLPTLRVTLWEPLLWSTPCGLQGNHWESETMLEKREGTRNHQHSDLGRWSSLSTSNCDHL